ncbi:microcompartments protein [Dethiosulfovibrio peptidovorans DSM 11002]|uniref:Microcompartments protein n=1 Tax=Dethiosulfovibrio peptidovorans DSM 11002 TaxID=469381 RepID=D2Z8I0_9BACT|nr:BMC domain-containing protein [Dethiosulfovibrio peptidovorans]EFC91777.1 microcompartments protein [Dethiosulfovibrio peptidovorans DSM 11002]
MGLVFRAIGAIELISVAKGFLVADGMVKSADVKLLAARTLCPGKFIVIVAGQVGAVSSSLEMGLSIGGEAVSDFTSIPNVHPAVFPALMCSTELDTMKDLGVVETMSATSAIEAADAAAKASKVSLIEIRIGQGMGAKAFLSFSGEISDVRSALKSARSVVEDRGLLVDAVVISAPDRQLKDAIR